MGIDSPVGGSPMAVAPNGEILENLYSRVGSLTVEFDPKDKFLQNGPAARCLPVCQGTSFPLRRNGKIIHYHANGRKGELIIRCLLGKLRPKNGIIIFKPFGQESIGNRKVIGVASQN